MVSGSDAKLAILVDVDIDELRPNAPIMSRWNSIDTNSIDTNKRSRAILPYDIAMHDFWSGDLKAVGRKIIE